MKLKQISLFVENKPGAVNEALKLLAANGINISTLSLSDTKFFGVLRLLIRDWEKARDILEANHLAVKITDVVAIEDIRHTIGHAIERILGIRVFVKMCAPNSIPRSEGKAKRVIDRRNLN